MGLAIDIAVEHDAWTGIADLAGLVDRAVAAAVDASGCMVPDGAEVSLVLCDDAFIRGLNRDWRGKDKATNVLSFPTDPSARHQALGDIVVAYETAAREAVEEKRPLDHHLSHLVVHGVFHLLGFDHENDAEADAMERLESRSLMALGIASPYNGDPHRDAEDRHTRP